MSEKCPLCGYDEFDHGEVNGITWCKNCGNGRNYSGWEKTLPKCPTCGERPKNHLAEAPVRCCGVIARDYAAWVVYCEAYQCAWDITEFGAPLTPERWLSAHQWFALHKMLQAPNVPDINASGGTARDRDVVALVHAAHGYIHSGVDAENELLRRRAWERLFMIMDPMRPPRRPAHWESR